MTIKNLLTRVNNRGFLASRSKRLNSNFNGRQKINTHKSTSHPITLCSVFKLNSKNYFSRLPSVKTDHEKQIVFITRTILRAQFVFNFTFNFSDVTLYKIPNVLSCLQKTAYNSTATAPIAIPIS